MSKHTEKEFGNEMDGNSLNIQKELKKKLFQILPEINVDDKIDFEKFKDLFGDEIEESNELYNFTWFGKGKAAKIAHKSTTATLLPNRDKSLNFDNTNNIYIEGDNLEVLKTLLKSYSNKIKMIYIDPPYNTGKDFVYTDNYKDNLDNYLEMINAKDDEGNRFSSNSNASGRYHTNWLNMMYPRLKLARNLLSEDGVIFISIDDNEQANLKEICDEVFGEDNFIGLLSIENNPKGRKNSAFISVNSEYMIIYAKNISNSYFLENVPKPASDMKIDENGQYIHGSGKRVLVGDNSFNKFVSDVNSLKNYSVYYDKSNNSVILKKEKFTDDFDKKLLSDGFHRYFSSYNNKLVENTYTDKKFIELHNNGFLEFTNDKIFEKNFNDTIRLKSQVTNKKYEAVINGKKQLYNFDLTTTGAGTYLKSLFNSNDALFSAPKNIGLLKFILTLIDDNKQIVLDFFSGSATTADAVMRLNAEDGGNRRYIMVQLPELTKENSEALKAGYKTIPEIAEERIRRAGKKILAEKPELQDKLDIGFKVFELDKSNFIKWNSEDNKEQLNLFDNNIIKGRTDEDILYEILLKQGLQLTNKIIVHDKNDYKVFDIDSGKLFVVIGSNIIRDSADLIASKRKEYKIEVSTVIFVDNGFKDDNEKLNAIEILKNNGYQDEQILSV